MTAVSRVQLEQTPLYVACDRNLVAIASWLIAHGADVNKRSKVSFGWKRRSALMRELSPTPLTLLSRRAVQPIGRHLPASVCLSQSEPRVGEALASKWSHRVATSKGVQLHQGIRYGSTRLTENVREDSSPAMLTSFVVSAYSSQCS